MKDAEGIRKEMHINAEYLGEELTELPFGYIDKTICACGATSVALENSVNTIIAVPSRVLVNNKVVQYPNERSKHLVLSVQAGVSDEEINDYVSNTTVSKIMVTYDSLPRLRHLLDDGFSLVIDESNKLLAYSRMKSVDKTGTDVITKVFQIAESYRDKVTFISATPTPLEYLPEWVSTLDYTKITFKNTVKRKPLVAKRGYPYASLAREILAPLADTGSFMLNDIVFTKAIVFMNSVTGIIKAIERANLFREDVAIIAGESRANDEKIGMYKRLEDPHNLPLVTFITSTGFEGIDLFDKEAVTIIVSNTDKEFQMLDHLTDVKQAMSRQRDKSNPHYGRFIHYYNQTIFDQSKEDLIAAFGAKRMEIMEGVAAYELLRDGNLSHRFIGSADFNAYTNFNSVDDTYDLNETLFNADIYFAEEIRKQYTTGFSVAGMYENVIEAISLSKVKLVKYKTVAEYYKYTGEYGKYENQFAHIRIIKETNKLYGKTYLDEQYAEYMIKNYDKPDVREYDEVRDKFEVGGRYPSKYVYSILYAAYKKYGKSQKPKINQLRGFNIEYKDTRNSRTRGVYITDMRETDNK